jgi:hypothetical protein
MARYAYLWKRPDEGLSYPSSVIRMHLEIRVADDHFFYVRGMPFVTQTRSYAACLRWLRSSPKGAFDILTRAKAHLIDFHGEDFIVLVQHSLNGDAQATAAHLRSDRPEHLSAGRMGVTRE